MLKKNSANNLMRIKSWIKRFNILIYIDRNVEFTQPHNRFEKDTWRAKSSNKL